MGEAAKPILPVHCGLARGVLDSLEALGNPTVEALSGPTCNFTRFFDGCQEERRSLRSCWVMPSKLSFSGGLTGRPLKGGHLQIRFVVKFGISNFTGREGKQLQSNVCLQTTSLTIKMLNVSLERRVFHQRLEEQSWKVGVCRPC